MRWVTNASLILSQEAPDNVYFRQAFDFAKSWISGQEEFVLQTSGSTGTPKLLPVTRQQLSASAKTTGEVLALGPGTKALACLNVAYIAGLMMIVRAMELGWDLVVVEPSANPLLACQKNETFDFVAMVPAQLAVCLHEQNTRSDVQNFGTILLGGAPVSASLQNEISNIQVPVYQSYGMTETVSHVALRRLNGAESSEDYRLLPGITFGVDDRGCLFVRGDVTSGVTIQTNDLVEITSPLTFRWVGRADNIINSGGVKIVLDKIDAVAATIFNELGHAETFFSWYQNDEKLGQKLILIIEGDEADFDIPGLIMEIRKRVSAYETPKHVYFAKRFAKTPTDKIDKRLTAALLLQS